MAIEDDVKDVLELHKKLATRYKEYETTDGEVPPVVVLNEMRYALRATVKILGLASYSHLSEPEKEILHSSLQEANHALRNAYHDLVDGILIQISRLMDNLLEKYPTATVNILADKRLQILKDINEVERHVADSRGDGINREQLYDTEIYEEWFTKIVEHYRFLEVALTEIIREDDRIIEKEKKETRKHQTTVLLTILGIVVSIVIAILNAG